MENPISEFKWLDNSKQEAEMVKYVNTITERKIPQYTDRKDIRIDHQIIHIDSSFFSNSEIRSKCNPSLFGINNITVDFTKRYSQHKLTNFFTYKNFIQNENIQNYLKELELDKDKFWYLLLFTYDYSESICINGINHYKSPIEQIRSFIDTIDELYDNTNADNTISFKKDVELKIKVKGITKPVTINDPTALFVIAESCRDILEDKEFADCYCMNKQRPCNDTQAMKDSPFIYFFAKILLDFMDTQQTVRSKRKKGAKHSVKEMDLVSELVYFTKLSTNKSFTDPCNETLKAFLRQYKNLDLSDRFSNIYPNFII